MIQFLCNLRQKFVYQSFLFFFVLFVSTISHANLKVGVYKGAFDPPHMNHVNIAREAVEQLGLDVLIVIPNCEDPDKPDLTAYTHRLKMSKKAFKKIPNVVFPTPEIVMATKDQVKLGGKFAAKKKLIEIVNMEYQDAQIFDIYGIDAYERFLPFIEEEHAAFANYEAVLNTRGASKKQIKKIVKKSPFNIHLLYANKTETSSTDIRNSLAAGEKHESLQSRVHRYIEKNRLYRVCEDLLSN